MNNLQHVNCNVCGRDNTALITIQNKFRFVECLQCGLVYMDPRPDQETLKSLYNSYHQRNGKDDTSWDVLMKGIFREVSSLLVRTYPSGGRLLDIGCGYGHFLGIMERCGWEAQGIDPSSHTVRYALKNGFKVRQTTIDECSFPESSFQAATLFYVLEHLTDPFTALTKVHGMLLPGGMLVVRVPHTTPVVRLLSLLHIRNNLYDAPFHLYDFSPAAITGLMEKAGFTGTRIMPGEPTRPGPFFEKMTSLTFGHAATFLYHVSGGKMLMPGVSKTIIAFKPGAAE